LPATPQVEETRKSGTAAAHGIGIGRAYLVDRRRLKTPKRTIDEDEVEEEVARLRSALDSSNRQLEKIKHKIEAREENEHYNIIAAHQLILADHHLVDETIRYIEEEHINAEWALTRTVEHIKGVFDAVKDEYFRERRSDVDFVGERVLRNLLGREAPPVRPPPDAIVVARDLSPADTAQLYRHAIAGLVTDAGGKTSHTAIIARAHEIPAVVGLEDISHVVETGDLLIVDGTNGMVIVNPTPQSVVQFRDQARREAAAGAALLTNRDLPAETIDGSMVTLLANIDQIDEITNSIEHGAEGIGLYRTEFLFMVSESLPTEDDHYEIACKALEAMDGKVATFRTFDLGAEKLSKHLGEAHYEANPALGLRSTRLCLTERVKPLFKSQLRGLLRASAHGPLRIMFPMISGLTELHGALALLGEAKRELARDKFAFDPDTEIGVMIEMPSAAILADVIAPEVDFFSIGTNDLIQYTLACDRVNEHVAYLYEPLHPALLRLIRTVVAAAKANDIRVSVCGEMAGDPLAASVLVGLGLTELSMNAVSIPEVKEIIRASKFSDLRELADRCLAQTSAKNIRSMVIESLSHMAAAP
jgi:phosphotransferase system enzyme I (PtsI)